MKEKIKLECLGCGNYFWIRKEQEFKCPKCGAVNLNILERKTIVKK